MSAPATTPLADPTRLAAIRRTGLTESAPDPALQRIGRLALRLLDVPIVLVTLVDEQRQFFAISAGLGEPWATARETPISHSFCRFVVERGTSVVIPDARRDPVLAEHPALRVLGVVAYAGMPLHSPDGHLLGTFAAACHEPHAWSADELSLLADLARTTESEIALRQEKRKAQELAAQVATVLDRMPEAVFVVDTQGRVVFQNERATALIEFTRPDGDATAVGRDLTDVMPHLRGTPADELLRRALREGTGGAIEHASSVTHRTYEVHVEPTVGGASVYVRDITTHRMLELQLRHAQKMEAVGQLAGGIAHDFNNLLSVVRNCGELALEATGPAEPTREDLREIIGAADRGAALVRRLLAFGRRQVLAPRLLSPEAVLGDMASLLQRLIGEHIRLDVRLARDAGLVLVDAAQLEQVVVNLVVNARDAIRAGGTLTIETTHATLEEEDILAYAIGGAPTPFVETPGDYVVLRVADTGTGMDADVQQHLFEPFFTTKAPGEGTGLGLATVYGIVSQSGGHVRVRSAPGEGTTMEVWLPRHEEVRTAPPTPADAPRAAGGRETLLVVEDEGAVRTVVRRTLERLGYRVIEARNGAEGIARWQERRDEIALVLTDVVMPELSGDALAERLRAEAPGLPILFMSGYPERLDAEGRRGVVEDSPAPPGGALLHKPFAGTELARRVREALDAARGARR